MPTLRTGIRRGFTTIELMVVMLIIVLMSTAVVIAMSPALSDARLRTGSRMIVSALNYARSFAVAHQALTRVVFDRATNTIRVETVTRDQNGEEQVTPLTTTVGRPRTLPKGLEISALEKPGIDEEQDFVGFTQTGQAEGATITITDIRGRQRRILIDGITGRCAIDENPKPETRNSKSGAQ